MKKKMHEEKLKWANHFSALSICRRLNWMCHTVSLVLPQAQLRPQTTHTTHFLFVEFSIYPSVHRERKWYIKLLCDFLLTPFHWNLNCLSHQKLLHFFYSAQHIFLSFIPFESRPYACIRSKGLRAGKCLLKLVPFFGGTPPLVIWHLT